MISTFLKRLSLNAPQACATKNGKKRRSRKSLNWVASLMISYSTRRYQPYVRLFGRNPMGPITRISDAITRNAQTESLTASDPLRNCPSLSADHRTGHRIRGCRLISLSPTSGSLPNLAFPPLRHDGCAQRQYRSSVDRNGVNLHLTSPPSLASYQIGRASCRERV